MPGTVSYLEHTAAWIVLGETGGGGAQAGPTLLGFVEEGGITISFEDAVVEQKAAQTGNHTLEAYRNPGPITVTASFAEWNNHDLKALLGPLGEKQLDTATPPIYRYSSESVSVGLTTPYAGNRMSTWADELRVIPADEYASVSTETSNQLLIFKAYPSNIGDIVYAIENAVAPEIQFKSLFDPTTAQQGANHWVFGLGTGTGLWAAA